MLLSVACFCYWYEALVLQESVGRSRKDEAQHVLFFGWHHYFEFPCRVITSLENLKHL